MKIITDNKPRDLVPIYELDERAQLDFDYIKDDDAFTPRLVGYKGAWYDTQDTQAISTNTEGTRMGWAMRVEEDSPLAQWHAVITESHFSGILFRFVEDDKVVVGLYSI